MNRKLKTLSLSALLLSAMVPATAQRWVEIADGATPVICISETVNEAPDVVEIFQNTQSGYYHDARAPRFILVVTFRLKLSTISTELSIMSISFLRQSMEREALRVSCRWTCRILQYL